MSQRIRKQALTDVLEDRAREAQLQQARTDSSSGIVCDSLDELLRVHEAARQAALPERERLREMELAELRRELRAAQTAPAHFAVRIEALERRIAALSAPEPDPTSDAAAAAPFRAAIQVVQALEQDVLVPRRRQWNAARPLLVSRNSRHTSNAEIRPADPHSADERVQAIVDRFRTEVLGQAPPMVVRSPDLCVACFTPLVVVIEGAALACPRCKAFVTTSDPNTSGVLHASTGGGASGGGGGSGDSELAPSHRSAAGQGAGARGGQCLRNQEARLRELLDHVQLRHTKYPPRAKVQETCQVLWEQKRTGFEPYLELLEPIARERQGAPFASIEEAAEVVPAECIQVLIALKGPKLRALLQPLKKLCGHEMFDDTSRMAAMLTGLAPPRFRPELEDTLLQMFRESAPLYNNPASNASFWGGYPYWAVGALRLLGRDEFVPYFSLPPIENKEAIRRAIYERLRWEFVPVFGEAAAVVSTPQQPTRSPQRRLVARAVPLESGLPASTGRKLRRARAPPRPLDRPDTSASSDGSHDRDRTSSGDQLEPRGRRDGDRDDSERDEDRAERSADAPRDAQVRSEWQVGEEAPSHSEQVARDPDGRASQSGADRDDQDASGAARE